MMSEMLGVLGVSATKKQAIRMAHRHMKEQGWTIAEYGSSPTFKGGRKLFTEHWVGLADGLLHKLDVEPWEVQK
jgi:hypothetical protein